MVTPPTRTVKPKPPATRTPAPVGNKKPAAIAKIFKTATWEASKRGESIIVYTDSGMGKTTLAAMLPNPKFLDFRGGSDKIRHPVTGERLNHIPGVETFDDVRSICRQPGLFAAGDSFVLDTGTAFEDVGLDWTLANVPHEKGLPIHRIEDYGWGKGYRHLYDTMRLPLADFDTLLNRGVNVIINCQMAQTEVPNSGGENFLCDIPKLQQAHGKHDNVPSVWGLYVEWADHVLKIGYSNIQATDGKAASSGERVIFVHGQVNFKAKSRVIPCQFPIVSFSEPKDDTIWQFLFDENWPKEDE
jgi:hypothetical protein